MDRTLAATLLCLMLATPTWAGFYEGLAAYKLGEYATALREWRRLAEQGHAKTQYNLGVLYQKGQGVPQDDAEALQWYRKAAEQGNARAQRRLGFMYGRGRGAYPYMYYLD